MAKKTSKLQKPAKYNGLVKARNQILDAIGLTPGHITTLPMYQAMEEISTMTSGRLMYEFLDYANENKWGHTLDDVMGEAQSYQDFVLGRIDTGRDVLGGIVNSLVEIVGMRKNNLRLERYGSAGSMLKEIFMFLNEDQPENSRRGIIKSLCRSKNEGENELGESMLELIKLARTTKFDEDGKIIKSPGGYVGNLMSSPTKVEVLYDSLNKDVCFQIFRRKSNVRIAEKLAYRIVIAEEALYDLLFNFSSFEKQAKLYPKYKNSTNSEERIKARRYKLYDQVYRAIKKSRSPGKTNFQKAFDTFCKVYKDFIIDDFFGVKIGTRTRNAALRVYNQLSPIHATSYESIPNWKPGEGITLESKIPGYTIVEIDNHASQDRLSSMVQIVLRKEASDKNRMPGPDLYEIVIQPVKDVTFDMFHPEIGHFRYESERKAAVEDLKPWNKKRFEAYSTYLEKMFEKVTPQNILEL